MEVVSCTSERAVVRFDAWELDFIVIAGRWVLNYMGAERYGRDEIHAVMGLWLEETEESLEMIGRLSPGETVELSNIDLRTAHGFTGEVTFRYLPLKIIADEAEFIKLMGVKASEARTFVDQLGTALA